MIGYIGIRPVLNSHANYVVEKDKNKRGVKMFPCVQYLFNYNINVIMPRLRKVVKHNNAD